MSEEVLKSVAIIIPAKDEEGRIQNVLRAAVASKLATEVIVVSDGSVDRTAEVARRFEGVRVVELPWNHGKGGAMAAGVNATRAQVVAFIDADLSGLTGEHVDQIIWPILGNRCDMCVGIFRGGKVWSDAGNRVSPFLSGQRALRRELFEAVRNVEDVGMGIELALTQVAKRRKARVLRVVLNGVANTHKEQKLGLMKGTAARLKMYSEITKAMVKTKKKPPRRPWL